jgi:hypothetical protein
MSKTVSKKIPCPRCKNTIETEMHPSINVTLDPSLRGEVMEESLFAWECPQCGYRAQLMYPCLYHDMQHKFMVYLIPDTRESVLSVPSMDEQFPELLELRRRLVGGVNELKEKILIFEAGLDDRAVELSKLALREVAAKKQGARISAGYFCLLDREAGQLGFTFFPEGGEPCYRTTRMAVYEKSAGIVKLAAEAKEDTPGFLNIGDSWAAETLRKYQQL